MFTWVREDPEALVLWVESIEDKTALINESPDRFLTTSHYDNHPIVLVRLASISMDEATELITESWRLRSPRRLVRAFDRGDEPPK